MKSRTPDMRALVKQAVERMLGRIDRMGGQFRISDVEQEFWSLAGPKRHRDCIEHHCRSTRCTALKTEALRALARDVRQLISNELRRSQERGIRLYEAIAKGAGERVWFSVKHAGRDTFLKARGTRIPQISGLQKRNVQLELFAEELSKCGPDAKGADVFDIVAARIRMQQKLTA